LENYVKEILFGYPLLRTVEEDYQMHIRNKAVLSHNCAMSAEKLAEYLAGEILTMRSLQSLKRTIEEVLDKLSLEERTLIEIRYFGRRKKMRGFLKRRISKGNSRECSETTYFRRQRALGEKVAAMLHFAGITKEKYLAEYASSDIFKKIHTFVEAGKDKMIAADERRLLGRRGKETEAETSCGQA
jgi:hypothetical protein